MVTVDPILQELVIETLEGGVIETVEGDGIPVGGKHFRPEKMML